MIIAVGDKFGLERDIDFDPMVEDATGGFDTDIRIVADSEFRKATGG